MALNFRSLQERLRERLLAHIAAGELTGLQLARETGFQQAHISNFLNRKRGLSLEAMDTILEAARIPLSELLPPARRASRHHPEPTSDCGQFVTVPIIDEKNCTATQVPNPEPQNTIKVPVRVVQKLPSSMQTPRPHWARFIALRVKASDALAMSPRMERGAVIVIDRHYNAPPDSGNPSIYLVRSSGAFMVRYVEHVGRELVLRAHNPSVVLEPVIPEPGHDPLSAIVGRVWLVHLHV